MADQRHEVDERLGRVQVAGAELARLVVHGKCVMVVVKALADRAQAHEQVLGRVDGLVVRSHAPHVRHAIDEPCGMQEHDVAQHGWYEIGIGQRLVPA